MELKPCPFCGFNLNIDEPDVLFPSGFVWTYAKDGVGNLVDYKKYDLARTFVGIADGVCYTIRCNCGVEVTRDSKHDVIEFWNTRIN